MAEEVVRFSCAGNQVYGILHRPEGGLQQTSRRGIIFLNAGSRPRSGPYRLYVRLSRELMRMGFYVLRFDLPGIGDSEGVLPESKDHKRKFIKHNESTTQAISFLKEKTGVSEVGLAGLCGGAFASLCAGATDTRVRFLILFSLPVEELGELSEETVMPLVFRQYLARIFRWRAWLNLLMLRSNFRVMFKALPQIFRIHKNASRIDKSLWKDLTHCVESDKSILFIYGGTDPLYDSFRAEYLPRLAKLPLQQRERCQTMVVENGNHIFSNMKWQQQIIEKCGSWLQQIDPKKRATRPS